MAGAAHIPSAAASPNRNNVFFTLLSFPNAVYDTVFQTSARPFTTNEDGRHLLSL
jgi:hypothetical protein